MTIMSLTKLLLDEKTTVNELVEAIGQNIEKRRRVYRLTSKDEQFNEVWLGVDLEANGEKPRYLKLHVSQKTDLQLDELTRLFGQWKRVPPQPEGDPFIVMYQYDEAALLFLGFIYVSLTGEPHASDSYIEKITIRREERLNS